MQGYPRLKFVDTATTAQQLKQIGEEWNEFLEASLEYHMKLNNNQLAMPVETMREGHDLCQSMTTYIRMLCEQHNIKYEDTFNECVDKGKKRNGKRSDRHEQ